MRQRLAIIATVAIILGVLILLNAASFVQAEKQPDSETLPNRSTYNSGSTGTRALYDLLNETGYKVMRWRESSDVLLSQSRAKVSTFVVIGRTLLPFEEEEAKNLLLWVSKGGRLVLIDRRPDAKLLPQSGNWTIEVDMMGYPSTTIDPGKPEEMTQGMNSAHPVQPTLLTQAVESVKPSKFVSAIRYSYSASASAAKSAEHGATAVAPTPVEVGPPESADEESAAEEENADAASEDPENDETAAGEAAPAEEKTADSADEAAEIKELVVNSPGGPVTHLQDRRGAMLVDFPHGAGRIIVLSDPYIVANGGIRLEDNLQLALNTVGSRQGLIAFDEYHQGRASTQNAWARYFSGTPVLALAGQVVLLLLVVIWTRSRRFGRPLPLPQVDRRSGLEFVASMAELQRRAGALDLAIENIYARTRRVLTRYAGVDYHSSRSEIAERVAARSSLKREKLERVMRDCEEAINGARISERQSITLVTQLREIEAALGLRMRSREVKQAAEKI